MVAAEGAKFATDPEHRETVVADQAQDEFGHVRLGGIGNLLAGGWVAAAVFTWQSGFPISVQQSNSNSNLLGNGLRPNVVSGVSRDTPGNWPDRVASADHPSAAWLNPAAFSSAPAGTFGHTGFTGPAMVVVPQERLIVVVLSNRIYPRRRPPEHHAAIAAIVGAALQEHSVPK